MPAPNDWADEVGRPRYILDLLLSVIVQTVDIVDRLPKVRCCFFNGVNRRGMNLSVIKRAIHPQHGAWIETVQSA
jgi:hypothetical protein